MKFTFSAALAVTALASTTTAFLDNCYCRPTSEPDFWKGDIDKFISRYNQSGPNELTVQGNYYRDVQYAESPVMLRIQTYQSTITLTKKAAVDLFWELKAKRSEIHCDNQGQGITCANASRGTPMFRVTFMYGLPPPTPTALPPWTPAPTNLSNGGKAQAGQ